MIYRTIIDCKQTTQLQIFNVVNSIYELIFLTLRIHTLFLHLQGMKNLCIYICSIFDKFKEVSISNTPLPNRQFSHISLTCIRFMYTGHEKSAYSHAFIL